MHIEDTAEPQTEPFFKAQVRGDWTVNIKSQCSLGPQREDAGCAGGSVSAVLWLIQEGHTAAG